MKDLFGSEIKERELPVCGPKKRHDPIPAGYASRPGSGPEGETCKTCAHICRIQMSGTYLKCGLMRRIWTGGGKTDIRASSPACSSFEKRQPCKCETCGKSYDDYGSYTTDTKCRKCLRKWCDEISGRPIGGAAR